MNRLTALGAALAATSCGDSTSDIVDASAAIDAAPLPLPDAPPNRYVAISDFPRDVCSDDGPFASFAYYGKWHNVPDDDSEPFDSYIIEEDGEVRGLLELLPVTTLDLDVDNLFLRRATDKTVLAVNLCALTADGAALGYAARCGPLDCVLAGVVAELTEPQTGP